MRNYDLIRCNLVIIIKETLKFALISFAIIWVLGVMMLYLFIKVLGLSEEISTLVVLMTVVISILFLSEKILHTSNKVDMCVMNIVNDMFESKKDQ